MIIQCQSCSKKFIVKDSDIPKEGRTVQCGYCSVNWHQKPPLPQTKILKLEKINKPIKEISEGLSVEKIKASDGKNYKFLGSQWAEVMPSGKTGLFAKRKIGKELDKLSGRKKERSVQKKQRKAKEIEINPIGKIINTSSKSSNYKKQPSDINKSKEGLGFFGYVFLIIIIGFSIIGVLKTFENDLLSYFPESIYIFELLNMQLEFFSETVKNMIVIVNDLINSY